MPTDQPMSLAIGMIATDMFTLSMLHSTNAQQVPSRMRYREGMERHCAPRSSTDRGNLGSQAGNSRSVFVVLASTASVDGRWTMRASDSSSSPSNPPRGRARLDADDPF